MSGGLTGGKRVELTERLLPDPTQARPGSAEKIAELARRAELGLQLWHPDDKQGPLWHFPLVVRYHRPSEWIRSSPRLRRAFK